jgi:hypothetical protein
MKLSLCEIALMPVFMNMFFVKDAAGHKPKFGVNTMKQGASEANRILTEKAAISFPLATEPFALSYDVDFGDPVNCGKEVGDEAGAKILGNLYRDKAGYAARCLKGRPAVNVFCVWGLKFNDPNQPPDGVTLDYRTILLCNRSGNLGLALAHELGHVLIGKSHTQSRGNLMFGTVEGAGEQISDHQISVMKARYKNRLTGAEGWKWEKKD